MATIYSSKQSAQASSTQPGQVVLATNQEVIDGLNQTKAVTPAALQAKIDELGGAVGGDVGAVQAELNTTQTGAGLNANGSYTAPVGTNYLGAASSLKNADTLLDTKIKLNADNIALKANLTYVNDEIAARIAGDSALDLRVDATETNITSIANDLSNLESRVDVVENDITTIEGNIISINNSLVTKASQIDVDAIETRVDLAETNIENLQTDVIAIDGRLDALEAGGGTTALQDELDATQTSVGVSANGSLPVYSSTNYILNTDSHHVAIGKLDTQMVNRANAIAGLQVDLSTAQVNISTLQSDVSNLEDLADTHEVSIGLNNDGTKPNYSSTVYILNTDSHHVAIGKLDQQLSATQNDLDSAEASLLTKAGQAQVTAIDGRLTTVEGDVTDLQTSIDTAISNISDLQTDISTLEGNLNALDLRIDAAELDITSIEGNISSIQSELDATQLGVGLNTNGTYSAHVGSNYIDGATSTKNALGLLDTQIKSNANDITNLETQIDEIIANGADNAAITALQIELDATQLGAGLSTTGAYTAPGVSNYLATASSLKNADTLLDSAIKERQDNIDALDLRIDVTESDIANIETDIISINDSLLNKASSADLDALELRVDTVETDIGIIEGDIATIETDLASKVSQVDFNTVESRVDVVEADIVAIEGDIVIIQNDVDTIETTLLNKANQVDLDAIESRVDVVEGDIVTIETNVSDLRIDLDSVASSVGLFEYGLPVYISTHYITDTENHHLSIGKLDNQLFTTQNDLDTAEGNIVTLQGDVTDLDVRLDTVEGNITVLQGDVISIDNSIIAIDNLLQTHESAIGLNNDGSYTAPVGGNYTSGATLKASLVTLDTQVKINSDAISTKASASSVSDLQTEVNLIETAVGLNIDGSYSAHVGSNYLDTSTSIKDALTDLDNQIKLNEDAISQEIIDRASADSSIQSELDASQLGAGLNANGSYTTPAGHHYLGGVSIKADVALLDSQLFTTQSDLDVAETNISNLQTEVNSIETSVGLNANGTKGNYSSTTYILNADSHHVALGKLDAAIAMVDTSGVGSIQTEIDAIETTIGVMIDANGDFVQPDPSRYYIDSATSISNAIEILDTEVKNNADAIIENATDISDLDVRLQSIELRDGGVFGQIDVRNEVIYDSELPEFQGFSGPWQLNLKQMFTDGASDLTFGWCSAPRMSDRHFLVQANGDVYFTGIEA